MLPRREAWPVRRRMLARSRSLLVMNLAMKVPLVVPGISTTTRTTIFAIRDWHYGHEKCGYRISGAATSISCVLLFCEGRHELFHRELELSEWCRSNNFIVNQIIYCQYLKLIFVAFTLFVVVSDGYTQRNRVLLIATEITVTDAE